MYLDRVKMHKTKTNKRDLRESDSIIETRPTKKRTDEVFEKWKDWRASEISHHGKICCEIAREWLTATDFSELAGGEQIFTGPRWLRQRFKWGASTFPIFWCEAVRRDTLDCGALAALAHEVFKARAVKSWRVQMVQKFSALATSQWENSWNLNGEKLRWTHDDLIYHEGCAISPKDDGEIKIWDASAGWWVEPNSTDGYGALLAIRLSAFDLLPDAKFTWGNHSIDAWQWKRIA